jgi:hypothetical protein
VFRPTTTTGKNGRLLVADSHIILVRHPENLAIVSRLMLLIGPKTDTIHA